MFWVYLLKSKRYRWRKAMQIPKGIMEYWKGSYGRKEYKAMIKELQSLE